MQIYFFVLKYSTVVWSPSLIQDIEAVESVQHKFTKRLPGLFNYSYVERLKRLELQSLDSGTKASALRSHLVLQNCI